MNILFTIGGDGTQRGGNALFQEAKQRGHALAVVGIPKTIDNDVRLRVAHLRLSHRRRGGGQGHRLRPHRGAQRPEWHRRW